MLDLFDDYSFPEAAPVGSGSGGTRPLGPDDPDYYPWNPPASGQSRASTAVNLWEGYDAPRLEPPTKVKKKGEWTCPQHGSLCSPGICKERARVERDERMRKEREKWEEEKKHREFRRAKEQQKRERKKAGAMGEGEGEWSSSSSSGSDSDTSHNQGTVFL